MHGATPPFMPGWPPVSAHELYQQGIKPHTSVTPPVPPLNFSGYPTYHVDRGIPLAWPNGYSSHPGINHLGNGFHGMTEYLNHKPLIPSPVNHAQGPDLGVGQPSLSNTQGSKAHPSKSGAHFVAQHLPDSKVGQDYLHEKYMNGYTFLRPNSRNGEGDLHIPNKLTDHSNKISKSAVLFPNGSHPLLKKYATDIPGTFNDEPQLNRFMPPLPPTPFHDPHLRSDVLKSDNSKYGFLDRRNSDGSLTSMPYFGAAVPTSSTSMNASGTTSALNKSMISGIRDNKVLPHTEYQVPKGLTGANLISNDKASKIAAEIYAEAQSSMMKTSDGNKLPSFSNISNVIVGDKSKHGHTTYDPYDFVRSERKNVDHRQENNLGAPHPSPNDQYDFVSSERKNVDHRQENNLRDPHPSPNDQYDFVNSERKNVDHRQENNLRPPHPSPNDPYDFVNSERKNVDHRQDNNIRVPHPSQSGPSAINYWSQFNSVAPNVSLEEKSNALNRNIPGSAIGQTRNVDQKSGGNNRENSKPPMSIKEMVEQKRSEKSRRKNSAEYPNIDKEVDAKVQEILAAYKEKEKQKSQNNMTPIPTKTPPVVLSAKTSENEHFAMDSKKYPVSVYEMKHSGNWSLDMKRNSVTPRSDPSSGAESVRPESRSDTPNLHQQVIDMRLHRKQTIEQSQTDVSQYTHESQSHVGYQHQQDLSTSKAEQSMPLYEQVNEMRSRNKQSQDYHHETTTIHHESILHHQSALENHKPMPYPSQHYYQQTLPQYPLSLQQQVDEVRTLKRERRHSSEQGATHTHDSISGSKSPCCGNCKEHGSNFSDKCANHKTQDSSIINGHITDGNLNLTLKSDPYEFDGMNNRLGLDHQRMMYSDFAKRNKFNSNNSYIEEKLQMGFGTDMKDKYRMEKSFGTDIKDVYRMDNSFGSDIKDMYRMENLSNTNKVPQGVNFNKKTGSKSFGYKSSLLKKSHKYHGKLSMPMKKPGKLGRPPGRPVGRPPGKPKTKVKDTFSDDLFRNLGFLPLTKNDLKLHSIQKIKLNCLNSHNVINILDKKLSIGDHGVKIGSQQQVKKEDKKVNSAVTRREEIKTQSNYLSQTRERKQKVLSRSKSLDSIPAWHAKIGSIKRSRSLSFDHSIDSLSSKIDVPQGDLLYATQNGDKMDVSHSEVQNITNQIKDLKRLVTGQLEDYNPALETNTVISVPQCGCLGPDHLFNESVEGPYYTHLGSGRSVEAIRQTLEKRTGTKGQAIRIEKLRYSGKEGKSSQGCPIAKWIIRRSSAEEKYLALVRQRPGHFCDTAWLIIGLVAWEGVPTKEADELYNYLTHTLPDNGFETERRCGMNDRKTCACQGIDLKSRGASFSFGCSWSMYFNGCKFARSQVARKFKLKNASEEEMLEKRLQQLATDLSPLYKQCAPQAHYNQCYLSKKGSDCRLGVDGPGPFSGVTACADFCAHAHKDIHNMNNGSTVVVTLTKHRGLSKPDDEQLHVLPLYVLEPTDETGSFDAQYDKIQNGAIEVLHHYPLEARLRSHPLESCKKRRMKKKNMGKAKGSPSKGLSSPWNGSTSSNQSTPSKFKQMKDNSFLHSQDSSQSFSSQAGSVGGTPIKHNLYPNGTPIKHNLYPNGTPIKHNLYPNGTPIEHNLHNEMPVKHNTLPNGAPMQHNLHPNGTAIQHNLHPNGTAIQHNLQHNLHPNGTAIPHNSHRNETPIEQNLHPNEMQVKQNSHPYEMQVKQNSHHNEMPVKHNLHPNEMPVKHNSHPNEMPVKHNLHPNEMPVKHNSHPNEMPVKHNSHPNEMPVKHNLHPNEMPVKHNSHPNEMPVKHNLHPNEMPIKHNLNPNETAIKNTSQSNETPIKHSLELKDPADGTAIKRNFKPNGVTDLKNKAHDSFHPDFEGLYGKFCDYFEATGSFPPPAFMAQYVRAKQMLMNAGASSDEQNTTQKQDNNMSGSGDNVQSGMATPLNMPHSGIDSNSHVGIDSQRPAGTGRQDIGSHPKHTDIGQTNSDSTAERQQIKSNIVQTPNDLKHKESGPPTANHEPKDNPRFTERSHTNSHLSHFGNDLIPNVQSRQHQTGIPNSLMDTDKSVKHNHQQDGSLFVPEEHNIQSVKYGSPFQDTLNDSPNNTNPFKKNSGFQPSAIHGNSSSQLPYTNQGRVNHSHSDNQQPNGSSDLVKHQENSLRQQGLNNQHSAIAHRNVIQTTGTYNGSNSENTSLHQNNVVLPPNKMQHPLINQDNRMQHSLPHQDNRMQHSFPHQKNQMQHSLPNQDNMMQHSLQHQDNRMQHSLIHQDNQMQNSLPNEDNRMQHSFPHQDKQMQHSLPNQDNGMQHSLPNQDNRMQHSLINQDNQMQNSLPNEDNRMQHSFPHQGNQMQHSLPNQDNRMQHSLPNQDNRMHHSLPNQDNRMQSSTPKVDYSFQSSEQHDRTPSGFSRSTQEGSIDRLQTSAMDLSSTTSNIIKCSEPGSFHSSHHIHQPSYQGDHAQGSDKNNPQGLGSTQQSHLSLLTETINARTKDAEQMPGSLNLMRHNVNSNENSGYKGVDINVNYETSKPVESFRSPTDAVYKMNGGRATIPQFSNGQYTGQNPTYTQFNKRADEQNQVKANDGHHTVNYSQSVNHTNSQGKGHTDSERNDYHSFHANEQRRSQMSWNMFNYNSQKLPSHNNNSAMSHGQFPNQDQSVENSLDPDIVKCEMEYNEEAFRDPNLGGVAVALCHGAVLFEVAKRELHATTGLKKPNRFLPTRISLVFYQHKSLNNERHGMYAFQKKQDNMKLERIAKMMEERGYVDMEEIDNSFKGGKKRKVEPTSEGMSVEHKDYDITKTSASNYRYMLECNAKRQESVTTSSFLTKWVKPQPMVTGPYQKWV